jgi:hypothetical protein
VILSISFSDRIEADCDGLNEKCVEASAFAKIIMNVVKDITTQRESAMIMNE